MPSGQISGPSGPPTSSGSKSSNMKVTPLRELRPPPPPPSCSVFIRITDEAGVVKRSHQKIVPVAIRTVCRNAIHCAILTLGMNHRLSLWACFYMDDWAIYFYAWFHSWHYIPLHNELAGDHSPAFLLSAIFLHQ